MARFKVGVQLHPQHTSIEQIRQAWQAFDRLGVDSIWTWDHFFPLSGEPNGRHFEGLTLLPVIAVDTMHAQFGVMVTCNSYRNPDLLAEYADMWISFAPPANYRRLNGVLNHWCQKVGRDPASIERTVSVSGGIDDPDAYLNAGAQHLIVELDPPYPTKGIERLLAEA